jgi:hypothetical protein
MIDELLRRQQENIDRLRRSARFFTRKVVVASIIEVKRRLREIPGEDHGGWTWSSEQAVYLQLERALEQLTDDASEKLLGMHRKASFRGFVDTKKLLSTLDKATGSVRPLRFDYVNWLAQEQEFLINKYKRSLALYGRATSDLIRQRIAESMLVGESWGTAADKLEKILPLGMRDKRWMVERTARTEMANAYNGVTYATLKYEDAPDDPMMKMDVAVFDARTASDSYLNHGQVVPVDQPFIDGESGDEYDYPPNRPNDRSIVVGWRKSYGDVDDFISDTGPDTFG